MSHRESVLGPLLFLIFINDITHVIRHCNIRLFVDDTCLFIEVEDTAEAAAALNKDLEHIQSWADKWLVTFSPPKTKEMLITTKAPREQPPLSLNNQPITVVESHKHLGVTLSNNLSWRKHAEEIAKKANKCLGILRPLKFKLDRSSLETMYKSFIRPVLEYADIIWDIPNPHRHDLDLLEKVQLNAARLVTGATARCSSEELYKEVGWETLAKRRQFHRSAMMHKIINGLAPQYLQELIPSRIEARTTYNLRNRKNLQVPVARLQCYSQSFFPSATRPWNDLTTETKDSVTKGSFKHKYLNQHPRPTANPLYYRGKRLPAVYHSRMRIGCSGLNSDLHHGLHVVDSPNCTHCNLGVEETAEHFLLKCPKFQTERQMMLNKLQNIQVLDPSVDILLQGDPTTNLTTNAETFKHVHDYITMTKRF